MDGITAMPVTIIVKAPNQQIEDQTVHCELNWTIKKLKGHLSEVYPSKPKLEDQKLIYSGRLLVDSVQLKDVLRMYDGQENHTVHLVCSPPRDFHRLAASSSTSSFSSATPSPAGTPVVTSGDEQRQDGGDPRALWAAAASYPAPPTPAGANYAANNVMAAHQMAWMQQAYSQYMSHYMQFLAATQGGVNNAYPIHTGFTAPTPQQQPAPVRDENQPAANPPAGGENEEEEGRGHRDWLDWFYIMSRVTVLFSVVYFYSSPVRFFMVSTLGLIMYLECLFQVGFFRMQGIEARGAENGAGAGAADRDQERENNNLPAGAPDQPGGADQPGADTAAATPPQPNTERPSVLMLTCGSGVANGEAESGVSSGVVFLQTNNEGKIQASRSQKDRERNPDRISLDRRGLTTVPILVGENKDRILSLQHNLITRLDNIQSLGLVRLVFLDIYDNQLDRIAGVDSLPNLRVLLMGKNRIRRMEGLKSLEGCAVLDLHGNQITQISGLTMLNELKVLNLAGNQIRVLGTYDLQGLRSLQELNLRRNRLKRLLGFAETPQLNKLFLSNNEIQSVEDMNSVLKAVQLKEISVDGNPVALSGDCASFLVSHLPQLQLLSHMQVTEQVRRSASAWRSTREASSSTSTNLIGASGPPPTPSASADCEPNKRDEVIYNARTNWELLRAQTTRSVKKTSLLKDAPRSDDSELESLPLSARAVRLPERAEVKRAEYSRRRTVSQGLEKVLSSPLRNPAPLDTSELYRLPPILAPLVGSPEEGGGGGAAETVSSVEPVADSSLSSLPSDTSSGADSDDVSEDAARWRVAAKSHHHSRSESAHAHHSRSIKSANNTASSSSSSQNKHSSYCRSHSQHRAQTTKVKTKASSTPGKIREQGGDYLVEISGRYLNVYGQGALKFIDRPWNPVKAGDVTTIRFNYVNFNSLAPVLCRLKQRFPNAEHFMFRDTNIQALGQLNALADIQGLTSLTIHPEGNPIYDKEWRSYAIYRLSHWGLSNINDLPVTEEEIVSAADELAGLSELVLSSLPDSLLQPLLSRLRLETQQLQSARDWLWAADPALRTVVAKEALQWRRANQTQDDLQWRHKGRTHLEFLIEQACSAFLKLKILEEEWSDILMELIRDTLVDYSQLDDYMKHCMNEITKN
ncbi:hypothetical protein LSTR_LSTR007484 [Laodelphax striatellus]|uniref:Ubiquitin-like domain-containing protein n=1 Tax=Laodelphax striatellus TaxID=195883 RepID=A0A482X5P2_LAOST|nr:hypothetical protein LSTR_LSTR007484 [Laodelphax striatellus]